MQTICYKQVLSLVKQRDAWKNSIITLQTVIDQGCQMTSRDETYCYINAPILTRNREMERDAITLSLPKFVECYY